MFKFYFKIFIYFFCASCLAQINGVIKIDSKTELISKIELSISSNKFDSLQAIYIPFEINKINSNSALFAYQNNKNYSFIFPIERNKLNNQIIDISLDVHAINNNVNQSILGEVITIRIPHATNEVTSLNNLIPNEKIQLKFDNLFISLPKGIKLNINGENTELRKQEIISLQNSEKHYHISYLSPKSTTDTKFIDTLFTILFGLILVFGILNFEKPKLTSWLFIIFSVLIIAYVIYIVNSQLDNRYKWIYSLTLIVVQCTSFLYNFVHLKTKFTIFKAKQSS